MSESGKRNTDKWFPVNLISDTDFKTGQTGKVVGDLTVKYKHSSATDFSTYSPAAGDWREKSVDGKYDMKAGADEFTQDGSYEVVVECAGCYPYNFIVDVAIKYAYESQLDINTLLTRIPSALNIDSGVVESSLEQILGVALTETSAGRFAGNISTFYDNNDSATGKVVDDVGSSIIVGPVEAFSSGSTINLGSETGTHINTHDLDGADWAVGDVGSGINAELLYNIDSGNSGSMKTFEMYINADLKNNRFVDISLWNYTDVQFDFFRRVANTGGQSDVIILSSLPSDYTDSNGDIRIQFLGISTGSGDGFGVDYAKSIYEADIGSVPSASEIAFETNALMSTEHGRDLWNGLDIEFGNIESVTTQSIFVLGNGPTTDDTLVGSFLFVRSASNPLDAGGAYITDWDAATTTVTIDRDLYFTVLDNDEFRVVANPPVDLDSIKGVIIPDETPELSGYMARNFGTFFNNTNVDSSATVDKIDIIDAKIGTPLSIAGGPATLAGMQVKVFDNNNGIDYDPATDSLHELTGIVVEAVPTNIISESQTLNSGTINGGSYEDTWTNNGVYFDLSPDGANQLDVELEFDIGDRSASSVTVNGRVDTAPGTVYCNVYAWNYVSLSWDQLSDAVTRMNESSVDQDYTYILSANNKEQITNKVIIRFLSNGVSASTDLLLDQVFIKAAAASATPAEIADAVYDKMALSIYGYTIHIDTVNGAAGTDVGVNGLPGNPSSNIPDAVALANQIGVRAFTVNTGSTLVLDRNFERWTFSGLSAIINFSGYDIDGCQFKNFVCIGTATSAVGRPIFDDCNFLTASLPPCVIRFSGLSGDITLNAAGTYIVDHCSSGVAGTSAPIFRYTSNVQLNLRHHSGGVDLRDMEATNITSMEGEGQFIIDSSCTGGTLVVRGEFEKTDNSGGAVTINENARYCIKQIRNAMKLVDDGVSISASSIEGKIDSVVSDGAKEASLSTIDSNIDSILATMALDATVAKEATLGVVDGKVDTIESDVAAIKVVTDIMSGMYEDVGGYRWTTKALEQGPSGGGAVADWTASEREEIRQVWGITGDKSTAGGSGDFQSLVSDVSVVDGNVDSILSTMALDSTVAKDATVARDATVAKESTLNTVSVNINSILATMALDATVAKETSLSIVDTKIDSVLSTMALDATVAKEATLSIVDTNVDSILSTMALDATVAKEATLDGVKVVTDILSGMYEDSAGYRWTTKALEQAPSGGGAVADWTASEREEIRQVWGITGDKSVAGGSGDFQSLVSDVAVVDSNVDSILLTMALDSTVAKEATLNTVDTNVDSILATMALDSTVAKEATLSAVDANVDSILATMALDATVAKEATLTTIDGKVDSIPEDVMTSNVFVSVPSPGDHTYTLRDAMNRCMIYASGPVDRIDNIDGDPQWNYQLMDGSSDLYRFIKKAATPAARTLENV